MAPRCGDAGSPDSTPAAETASHVRPPQTSPSPASVRDTLDRLRAISDNAALADAIPAELCRAGFSRAMYSTIEQAVHAVGNPLQAKTLLRIGLVTAAQPDAYAAAPIDLGHRPVGMLHADRSTVAGTVDASDLDLIGILAEGIGVIIERNIATQQLRSLQSAARQHMHEIHSLAAMFDEYPASDTDAGPGTGPPVKPVDDNDGLTHRELQVLRLMAAGSTNKQIADQLGIGAGTVKSHVRNILTKLGVHNRADAVAKSPELLSF